MSQTISAAVAGEGYLTGDMSLPSEVILRKDDLWKCSSSPTGAHHWIYDQGPLWECRYCPALAWFPRDQVDAQAYNTVLHRLGYKVTQIVMQNPITRQVALNTFRGGRLSSVVGQLENVAEVVD